MKCVICRNGETTPGKAMLTLERDGMTLVIKGVPARVCANCDTAGKFSLCLCSGR